MPTPILNKNFTIGNLYFKNEQETRGLIYEIFYQSSYLLEFLSLSPGSVVFDVGANIGLFSIYAFYHCQGDALVHCFEPIPETYQCLEMNLSKFGESIILNNIGIANVVDKGTVEFNLFGNDSNTATYKPEDKLISNYMPLLKLDTLLKIAKVREKALYYKLKYLPFMRKYFIKQYYEKRTKAKKILCDVVSLAHYLEQHKVDRIDFLKIDVEGAEFDVLKSIHDSQFSFIRQICIEVHDIDNRVKKVDRFLKNRGYLNHIKQNKIFRDLGMNQFMIYAKKK